MNPFLFSIVALCLATSGSIASQYNSGYQQRKMAPSPQTYGASAYGQQQASYGAGEQHGYGAEMSSYEQPAQQSYNAPQQQQSYKAPSSAHVSTYDERTPAASGYGKQQQSYQQQSSYGAAAAPASGYGKQAVKYEEPSYPPMPFAWGYDINDGYGGAQYHKETGDEYGKRTGSYGYTDAYGIYRQVDYVADEHGFRATIKTNEPGTSNESPADVQLHAYEPPSNYYAGNQNSYGNGGSSYGGKSSGKGASYSAPAAHTYSAPSAQTYSAPAAQAYSAPAAPSYGGYQQQQHQRSSYGKMQSSYAPARQSYQQEQQSYSSSAIVPVKVAAPVAAAAAVVPAKKH